jgi:hypothetical protein
MHRSVIVAAVACLLATQAQASMIGTSVTAAYEFGATSNADTVTATGGADITCPGAFNICGLLTLPTQTLSFGASSITYALQGTGSGSFTAANPARFVFSSLTPGFAIGSVSLSTNIVGLDASALVLLSPSSVALTMSDRFVSDGSTFTLTLNPASVAVPAPGAALLLLAGLMSLAATRRGA